MRKHYAKEVNFAPAVGDFELYLATDVDAEIERLERDLREVRKERDQYSKQLFTIGQILGDWAMNKHAQGKRADEVKP